MVTYKTTKTIPLAIYGPGCMFGELELLMQSPRQLNVMSVTNCVLLVLDKKSFTNIFFKQHPQLGVSLERIALQKCMYIQKVVDFVNDYLVKRVTAQQQSKILSFMCEYSF